jgi:HD superfamily phosphohydrolase
MARKKKMIRDMVYEYVYFTPVEELIIEDNIFQRLRFIYQNSSAYLTYPSNQLTRFSHSLGVMHIGGLMILSALKNTSTENFWSFLNIIERKTEGYLKKNALFNSSIEEFEKEWQNQFLNICDFSLSDKLADSQGFNLPKRNPHFLVNYLWQSIRIACLIHDIGHFPFSHVFEMGLESFRIKNGTRSKILENLKEIISKGLQISPSNIKKPTELHEYFGAFILKNYSAELGTTEVDPNILRACLEFAIDIFTFSEKDISKIEDEGVLSSLHQIVSSFLDADRIDYVLRDSYSSGLQVGNYDYKRIIDNLHLFKVEKEQKNKEKKFFFQILVTEKALSSVEQFYNHRYILYEYLYFHHNVCKYDGILMEIIAELLKLAVVENNILIQDTLLEFEFLVKNSDGTFSIILTDQDNPSHRTSKYDDCWLRALLQKTYERILDKKESFPKLHLLVETFLFRKTNNTYSVLKRDADVDKYIEDFIEYLKEKDDTLYQDFISHRNKSKETFKLTITSTYDHTKFMRYLFSAYFKDESDKPIKSNFLNQMASLVPDNIVFIHKDVAPKLVDEDARLYFNGVYKDCAQISPYLESTKLIKKTSFNHYFGFLSQGIKVDSALQSTCKLYTFEALKNVLQACIERDNEDIKLTEELEQRKEELAKRH